MKSRVIRFFEVFFLWVLIFLIQKPIFMLVYHSLIPAFRISDFFKVIYHGLVLDFSLAGYLTVIPAFILFFSIWSHASIWRKILSGYYIVTSFLVASSFVLNLLLYKFWRFPLDSTPLFYFFSSPKLALASTSYFYNLFGLFLLLICQLIIYFGFYYVHIKRSDAVVVSGAKRKSIHALVLLLLTGSLFLPIRGGVTVSTMNTGKVYFSPTLILNHAAVNPLFSLMESMLRETDFASQYRFMKPEEADSLFYTLLDPMVIKQMGITVQSKTDVDTSDSLVTQMEKSDSLTRVTKYIGAGVPVESVFFEDLYAKATLSKRTILSSSRPDILLIILESFSSQLFSSLGGLTDVTHHLDSIAKTGILFTNFYANSFRTDRALVSILSGYPAQPTTSLMKYPRKTAHLPSLTQDLISAGYNANYYYGGDADFTNMRSYLVSQGFDDIVSDTDFPLKNRLTKWGVNDETLFNRLLRDLNLESGQYNVEDSLRIPKFRVIQTSSSHEPFEVPFQFLPDKILNAFAYTDYCVGNFIQSFSKLPQWKNTLVIIVPDHLGGYPEEISNFDINRYKIPLILSGGAVAWPGSTIDVIGSQQDIAATLLSQLGLSHAHFTFSKDMLNPDAPHFAFFTVPDAFGMVTIDNQLIFDNKTQKAVLDAGKLKGVNLLLGKAYLQKIYDDISRR